MQIVLKLSHQDLARLAEGGRVEVSTVALPSAAEAQELTEAYAAIRALMKAADKVGDAYHLVQPFLGVVLSHIKAIGRAIDATEPPSIIEQSKVFIEIDGPEIGRSVRRNSSPPKYLPCAACHGTGFIDDSCCVEREGTARVLVRPQVSVGDWVRIVKIQSSASLLTLVPWGFLVMPRPTPTRDRVCIPSGTVGVVVDIEQGGIAGDEPSFVIDLILDKVLYRVVVESQYVKPLGVGNDKNASDG